MWYLPSEFFFKWQDQLSCDQKNLFYDTVNNVFSHYMWNSVEWIHFLKKIAIKIMDRSLNCGNSFSCSSPRPSLIIIIKISSSTYLTIRYWVIKSNNYAIILYFEISNVSYNIFIWHHDISIFHRILIKIILLEI